MQHIERCNSGRAASTSGRAQPEQRHGVRMLHIPRLTQRLSNDDAKELAARDQERLTLVKRVHPSAQGAGQCNRDINSSSSMDYVSVLDYSILSYA